MNPAPPVTSNFMRHAPRTAFFRARVAQDFFADHVAGMPKRFEGAGIGPPAVQHAVVQRAFFDVAVVHVGDLVLAASRRLQPANAIEDRLIVEINADHGIRRERLGWLLFDANDAAVLEDRHAEALGIGDFLQHHHRALFQPLEPGCSLANVAFNDVVAQHDADLVALGPRLGQPQRVGDAAFALLIGEAELLKPELLAVLQQAQKIAGVVAAGDDQDVANAGVHQDLQRVEDHGFVVHREQVLVGDAGERIKARANTACQDYALHRSPFMR